MNNIFKPAFFSTEKVFDSSTISNGQFIVDVQTCKTYVDYNNQRFLLSPFQENSGSIKEFEFTSSTSGVTTGQNGTTAVFTKVQLDVINDCPVQLFDNSGYEIGSSSDVIMRWNPTTGNLEIQSESTISGTWLLKLYDDGGYSDFHFDSSTEGYTALQTSGFTATFTKSQLQCGQNEPMIQMFDSNGYEIGSGSDISMRWNPTTGNLEIQSITNISGTWTIKFALGWYSQGSGSSEDDEWYEIEWSNSISLDPENGRNQRITMEGNTSFTSPTLTAENPKLMLEIIKTNGNYSATIENVSITDSETVLVQWFYDGVATRRLPNVYLGD